MLRQIIDFIAFNTIEVKKKIQKVLWHVGCYSLYNYLFTYENSTSSSIVRVSTT